MSHPKLAMTDEEVDDFLTDERVMRMATVDEDGWPVVVPVWFVWWEGAFWVWNLDRAERTERLETGTRVGVVVDGGEAYEELRGVSSRVDHELLDDGEVPVEVRVAMGAKYFGMDGEPLEPVDDHTWMRLEPRDMSTWDFRKVM